MKEKPILFSAEMVRAILEGRKSQTRRIVKPQPNLLNGHFEFDYLLTGGKEKMWCVVTPSGKWGLVKPFKCPYGIVGDRLWVRETFCFYNYKPVGEPVKTEIAYKADNDTYEAKWKPSIFMPRKYSRITLEITDIRVERLRDITKEEASEEGIEKIDMKIDGLIKPQWKCYSKECNYFMNPINSYKSLWELINGKDSWASNPWVWVITFRKL